MFTDEQLEKIFNHKGTSSVPIEYQAIMISVIDDVLSKEEKENANTTVSKS